VKKSCEGSMKRNNESKKLDNKTFNQFECDKCEHKMWVESGRLVRSRCGKDLK
jgi:uncharacterized protein YlaI